MKLKMVIAVGVLLGAMPVYSSDAPEEAIRVISFWPKRTIENLAIKRSANRDVKVITAEEIDQLPYNCSSFRKQRDADIDIDEDDFYNRCDAPAFRTNKDEWIAGIRKLLRNAERKRAGLELCEFERIHTKSDLPSDLAALLP